MVVEVEMVIHMVWEVEMVIHIVWEVEMEVLVVLDITTEKLLLIHFLLDNGLSLMKETIAGTLLNGQINMSGRVTDYFEFIYVEVSFVSFLFWLV